jgi:hypothetical protein
MRIENQLKKSMNDSGKWLIIKEVGLMRKFKFELRFNMLLRTMLI